jgi:hypothetical protein
MLDIEIRSINALKHHEHENIIKFMIFKITHEIACLLSLFSDARFVKYLKVNPENKEFCKSYVNNFTVLKNK